MLTAYTNKPFRTTIELLLNDKTFRINPEATVRARFKSANGESALTNWVTLTHNANINDDWGLSTLDVIISATETAKLVGPNVILDIEVDGVYVDRDNNNTSNTYQESWSTSVVVEIGLA